MPRAKVTVYLDEDIGNALSAQAASEGRSVSQMAGRLLADLLATAPSQASPRLEGTEAGPASAKEAGTRPAGQPLPTFDGEHAYGEDDASQPEPVLVTDPEFSQ